LPAQEVKRLGGCLDLKATILDRYLVNRGLTVNQSLIALIDFLEPASLRRELEELILKPEKRAPPAPLDAVNYEIPRVPNPIP